MGRRKLALELILNEKARRTTYKKRKMNLMKKAQEFSTLCGVDTCMIIFDPTGSAAAAKPEIWPASPEKVKRIIERYMNEGADCRAKRMVGLPEFFMARKRKVDAELAKARLVNWEAKYPVSKALIEGLSKEDLKSLLGSLRGKLKASSRQLSHAYDHNEHAKDHIHYTVGSFEDHFVSGSILPEQDFHFANSEGMMLSKTSSYSPNTDNLSPKGSLSFSTCSNSLMDQPALPPVPLPGQDFANSEEMMHSETSSYSPNMDNLSPEDALSFSMCYNSLMDQPALPPVPLLGQDFHFTNLEEMMLSETHSYGPNMDNLSPEDALSFVTCYNSLMDQPAQPPVPLSGQDFHFANLEEMMLSETSSYSPNMDNLSPEDALSFVTCYNSLMDQPTLPPVPLSGQDFHFANSEGMMLSETSSSYGPNTDNLSPEGALSFGTCYNSPMDQPALHPVLLSVMQGDPLPSQMMQATSLGNFQLLDYY